MRGLREKYGIGPMAIHSSYLVNLASATPEFHRKSVEAFRGELERALALSAEYLVLHPGSFRGRSREEGLELVARSIAEAAEGLELEKSNLRVLIENTAGAEFSLGGSFDQVAHLLSTCGRSVRWAPALTHATRTFPVMTLFLKPAGTKPCRSWMKPSA